MEEFVKYRSFQNKATFEELILQLDLHEIEYLKEDYPINFIADKSSNAFNHEYLLKLKKKDFNTVDNIQEEIAKKQSENLDPDYYLYDFSDEELINVIREKDAWSSLDIYLAKKKLKDKGLELSDQALADLETERLKTLSEPDRKTSLWVFLGYISSIFGGLFGILIGIHLMSYKKTLPNGDRVFDYSANDRRHGKIILLVGLFVMLLSFILKVIADF